MLPVVCPNCIPIFGPFRLLFPVLVSRYGCPAIARVIQTRMSVLASPPLLSCYGGFAVYFLSLMYCPDYLPQLSGLVCPFQAVVSGLSCPCMYVSDDMFRLYCHGCPVKIIPFQLSCPSSLLAVIFWPSCPLFPVLAELLSGLFSPAVLSRFSFPS